MNDAPNPVSVALAAADWYLAPNSNDQWAAIHARIDGKELIVVGNAARPIVDRILTEHQKASGGQRVVEFRGIEDLLRAASKVSVPEDLADDPRLKSYGAQFATMLLQRGGE